MKEMTIQNYLQNPAGVGAASIPNRELIRGDLSKRFESLLQKKRGSFNGNVYKDDDTYFIHVLIPSESTERENTYDVVIKFIPTSNDSKMNSDVRHHNIQVFSNSPSFTYTYAYVFDKEELLVKELRDKFHDNTFEPPTTRNPYASISYEKSIFMAIMYILANPNLMDVGTLKKGSSVSALRKIIRNTDQIKIEHSKEKHRLASMKTQKEISAKKTEMHNMSVDDKSKPKRGKIKGSVKPIKPRSKIKPKAKTTASTSMARMRAKRNQ